MLHVLRVRRHEHLHVVLGLAVAALAVDEDLVHLAAVEVADRALDQAAFLVDRRGRDRLQRQVADHLPLAQQVFVVALDLGLGARGAGGADDQARAVLHGDRGGDLLELLAVGGVGDLAGDAAAAGGVGHQDAVAAGEAQVGGEGGALVAALLLDDLDQQDLADLDHFLDLVAARARRRAARGALLGYVVAADGLEFVRMLVVVAPMILVAVLGKVVVGRRLGGPGFGPRLLGFRVADAGVRRLAGGLVGHDDVDVAGGGRRRRHVVERRRSRPRRGRRRARRGRRPRRSGRRRPSACERRRLRVRPRAFGLLAGGLLVGLAGEARPPRRGAPRGRPWGSGSSRGGFPRRPGSRGGCRRSRRRPPAATARRA